MRVFGLAIAVALAVAAYAAGSAAALPEFGRCTPSPTHEGRYTNNGCTTKAKKVGEKFTGEYEWEKSTTFPAGNFKEVRGYEIDEHAGPVVLTSDFVKCEPNEQKLAKCREGETEERVPVSIECANIRTAEGEFSSKSSKEISHFQMVLAGCETLGISCNNTDTAGFGRESKLELNALKGVLGYIKKTAPKEVGIAWKAESGKDIADFTCGEDMRLVIGGATEQEGPNYPPKGGGGAWIAAVTPINEMVLTITQSATVDTETAENIPSKFEGQPLQALEGYFFNPNGTIGNGTKWSPTGFGLTERLVPSGVHAHSAPAEVKA
jgi:hypothetical protein